MRVGRGRRREGVMEDETEKSEDRKRFFQQTSSHQVFGSMLSKCREAPTNLDKPDHRVHLTTT